MSKDLTPDEARAQHEALQKALLDKGVSEALVEKAEGISLWLQDRQTKLESAYAHCPCYRVDVPKALLAVGDVLLDEWHAQIIAALGTYNPEEKSFLLAPHDPSCPPALCAQLKRVIAEDQCLKEIPESQGGSVVDIDEDHVWLLTGVMAMALEADGLHVAQSEGKLVFLAIKGLRRLSDSERQLNDRRASELILQMGAPARELFQQISVMLHGEVESKDPEFVQNVLPQLLQDSVTTMERFVNELEICTNHARMADSPIADTFEKLASEYRERLDKIDAFAKAGDALSALTELSDTGVSFAAELEGHSKQLA